MGQEASVPRNNHGPDHGGEFPSNSNNSNNNHQAPPQGQGGRVSSGNNAVLINTDLHVNAAAAVVSPGVAAGGVGLAGGGVGSAARMAQQYHQQQQQQQPQSQHQLTAGSAAPPPPQHSQQYQQQQQHHPQQQGGSSSSSGSLMSRAGFTSMIQRMGGSSRGVQTGMAGGSGHGSSRRAGGKSPANNHNQNGPHYPQPPPSPQRGGAELSPSLNNNNGAYSPQRPEAYSIHHNDLSPESKARKHAMMMKNQQQQQLLQAQQKLQQQGQQIPHPPPLLSTQQSSGLSSGASYHTATGTGSANTTVNMMYTSEGQKTMGSSSKTLPTSNLTEHDTANNSNANNGGPASSLVQGMKNMAVSPGRNQQQSSQQQLPQPHKSPPSPRQQSLKKMQNNDEEDWQKAWEEDSESDDDDDEGDKSSTAAESGSPSKRMLPPVVPSLEIPPAGGKPPLGQERAPPAAAAVGSALPYRPDMDSGHSSASVQVVPPPVMNSAMHHAFTPVTSQQPNQQQYYSQQQQQQQYQSQQQFQHQQQQQQQQQIQQQQYQQQQQQSQPPQKPSFIGNQKAIATASSSIKTPIIQYTPTKEKAAPTSRNEVDEDTRLTREANEALMGEDGQQHWDSYARDEEANEKPCVDMFDPALRVLGRGSFGRVVLVQKRQGQGIGSLYAMKILRKSHLVRRRQIERTKTERKVLSVLDHPFIMKMYYAFQTPEKLFLVLDYCPGGELFFHLSRYRRFQEPVARFYAAELLLAIGHLHKNGIIYRDLKPENVLLDAYGHVKLGDFGLAKDGIRHPTQGAKSTCGTPEYMAPEVLNQTGHGFCVDYWGLGMILYEMMTGLPPWYTTDRSKLFRRLRSAPLVFPNEVQFSPACRACIAGLLDREPRLRLGVMGLRSAVRHEFFYRRINFEALRARQIAAPIRPCEGWRQLQSRSSSMATNDSDIMGGPGGRHASLDSATMGGISAEALDVATANFDDSFRRMPIETEDYETQQQAAGHAPISENELNAGTFRGFTFDGDLPPTTENDNHHQQSQNRYQSGRPPPGRHNSGV